MTPARWSVPTRYAAAIGLAHAAFRAAAEAGYLATDTRGRIQRGPRLG